MAQSLTEDLPSDTTSQSPASSATPPRNQPQLQLWPGLIIALLGSQIILMLVMVYMATSDQSFAVEPDYYRKALRWDAAVGEQQASDRLGWAAQLEVSEFADIYKIRDVTCSLTDRSGNPISDASVQIIAFSHARGNERVTLDMKGGHEGRYGGQLRIGRPGVWEFRVTARRGDETYRQVQMVQVAAAQVAAAQGAR